MANVLKIKDASKKYFVYQLLIVGGGANGSHFFRNVLQMVRTHLNSMKEPNFEVDITIVDRDIVEEKNLGNQLFDIDDIGEYKVTALAERYGEHYNIEIKRVKEYVKDLDMLHRLLPNLEGEAGEHVQVIPILCSMVDNNKTRQLFHEFFMSDEVENLIYLDAAVEGVTVLQKPEQEYTQEDWDLINHSGFGGQIVCGLKMNGEVLLEPVGNIYTNILEDAHSAFPDESCGEFILNNPQRCMTNQIAAQLASTYINNLLYIGGMITHRTEFNAQFAGSRPVFVDRDVIEKAEQLKRPVA